MYGLFHGMLFLPVILSLVGPGERKSKKKHKNLNMQYQNGYYSVDLSQKGKGNVLTISMYIIKQCLPNRFIFHFSFTDIEDVFAKWHFRNILKGCLGKNIFVGNFRIQIRMTVKQMCMCYIVVVKYMAVFLSSSMSFHSFIRKNC